VKEGTPVNVKSIARLGTVTLMSAPAISITTGTRDAQLLTAGQTVLSEETVSMDEMARKVSGIVDNANVLMAQVQGELKSIGGQAQVLLTNLNGVTGPGNRKQIEAVLRQMNELVSNQTPKIDQITSQVLQTTHDADAAIGKVGPVLERADATVANVNTTIDQLRDPIRQDLAQVQSTMEQVKSLIASVQTVVRGNDVNLRQTLDNIRIASENLDQLSDQVKQRPWSLIRIRQPEDRKVPQETKQDPNR
jgi:ABC-type transporter Mla subunit MlaD